jgi:hypothetical protein
MLVRQPSERDDLLDRGREGQRRELRNDGQAAGDGEAIEPVEADAAELH